MSSTVKKHKTVTDDYLRLIHRFPLRPIRSEADYDAATELYLELMGRGDHGLNAAQTDYLAVLGGLIGEYDDAHYPVEHVLKTPLSRLKYLMREQGMKTTELGELLGSGRGQASLILNGRRELSKANIRTLAARFKVSPAAFL